MKVSVRSMLFVTLFLVLFGSIATSPAWGQCQTCLANLNLPITAFAAVDINFDDTASLSFLTATLSGVTGSGLAVSDSSYNAWCVDVPSLPVPASRFRTPFFSSYGTVIH